MSADHNLLFGVLALHNGFVSRGQLLAAMSAWLLRKGTPLGVLLREQGALAEDDLRALEGLVDRHVKMHGDAQKSLASLRADPEARRELDRLEDPDVQASLASLGPAAGTTPPAESARADAERRPGGPMRYRRLHFHARGGLGEVQVALDEELSREVALKQIQERFADDAESRRRFLREAEVTGNLEHPGVVPVYGLLDDEDGRPVYAMRFIRGETMQEVVARFHQAERPGRDPGERTLALRGLLGRFVAVCNALSYAHARGVVHRDLKPANVMIGEYGETLVVDWGLARVLRQADPEQTTPHRLVRLEDAETETRLGQALGTPAFMPPEQARGEHDRVSVASDVFALGATLYAILVGRAPYAGGEALERAKRCDFEPPRRANARAPRALEAVCLKAMCPEPESRYPGARALAEEVERFLADEPVSAYREPALERARRWGRRHRTLVASSVVLLVTAVAGLGVGLWAVGAEKARTQRALEEAEENLGRALAAEQEASENFEQARKAVDECFGLAKDDPLLQPDHLRQVRKRLLEKTLPFYEWFAGRSPGDEALRERQAEYLFRVGHITSEIGRQAQALQSYARARDTLLQLSKARPDVAKYRVALAWTWYNLGNQQRAAGQPEEALGSYLRARDIQLGLARAHAEVADFQAALARTWGSLGLLQNETGKPGEALRSMLRARDILLGVIRAHPEVARFQADLARTWGNLAALHRAAGRPGEALESNGQARDILLGLSRAHPGVTAYRADAARIWYGLGNLQREAGKHGEALESYVRARDIQLGLTGAHPQVAQYQSELADTWNNLGLLQSETGKPGQALRSYERARDVYLMLSRANPEVHRYQGNLAGAFVNLSNLQRGAGNAEEALKSAGSAIPLLAAARRRAPRHPTYRLFLRNAHWSRARALARLGRHREAVADWDEALRLNATPAATAGFRLGRADALARAGDYIRAAAEAGELAGGGSPPGAMLYDLSCAFSLSASAASRDAARPLPEREKYAEAWSRQAVSLLRSAAAAGFFRDAASRARLGKDSDLDSLRGRDDYRAFAGELEAALPRLHMPTSER
jgi:serine/threonine-protein kinase